MNAPKTLPKEGKLYWKRHYSRLVDSGKLAECDVDSFTLLCQVYGLMKETDPKLGRQEAIFYMACLKQYASLAKQFGLYGPKDRIQAKMDDDKPKDDLEF